MRKYQQQHLDQYYTNPDIANNLVEKLNEFVSLNSFSVIIEPSAGNGSFLNPLYQFNSDVLGFDIEPNHIDIIKLDFLNFDPNSYKLPSNKDDVLCIGNPPYGVSSSLVNSFIIKCSSFSNHIAFILPQSILTKKNLRAIPINFHPVLNIPIKGNPFLVDGQPYDKILKTSFIYFQNLGYPRVADQAILSNGNWSFLKKSDPDDRASADFRIIQNGGRSGKCILKTDDEFILQKKSNIYTDFFIRIDPSFTHKLKSIQSDLNKFEYTFNNLTTWKSLGKNRVAEALNSIIQ